MKMHGHISSATQLPAAARPSPDGGWRVVFPPAVGTHNPRSRETTRVTPFAHLHIESFANYSLFTIHYSLGLSADNPVKLVDPNGEDWYENECGKIVWDDNVTKKTKLPKGCTYIGTDDKSIAKHYKMDVSGEQTTHKGGMVSVCDSRQAAAVDTKTNISTVAVTKTDANARTSSNKLGKVFVGIRITATAGTISTHSADVRLRFAGKLSVNYGGKTYSQNFQNDKRPDFYYEQNQTASVLIPASNISISKSYSDISITGNWSAKTDCGFSLLTRFLFPISLKHKYL